ncbi:NUDIX hydrolase [Bradyrhizobium amphicarpaeae]|uniref:Nudix hydrolase domain-containing protein n=1 Tax=Bradyrhizobium amphicarpaeae TaxID=1404768 RepID=A0A2U8PVM5_9BRAD|nr:NUDIX hydrolase [Bradyrhizobium amphicarpaeae]AWM01208.1 hypothetical protein CIT40_14970 [Bradyrhizobium amphicarpaeae]
MKESEVYNFDVFSVHTRTVNTAAGTPAKFHTLKCPNWVNAIVFTSDNLLALVKQYRHGIDDYTIEFPGGLIEQGSLPLDAIKQEVVEETGLISEHWSDICCYRPNAALQDNLCYTFACHSARNVGAHPEVGSELILTDLTAFKQRWRPLLVMHSLMATSMFLSLDYDGDVRLKELLNLFFRDL